MTSLDRDLAKGPSGSPEPERLRSFADGLNDVSVALYDRLRQRPDNLSTRRQSIH